MDLREATTQAKCPVWGYMIATGLITDEVDLHRLVRELSAPFLPGSYYFSFILFFWVKVTKFNPHSRGGWGRGNETPSWMGEYLLYYLELFCVGDLSLFSYLFNHLFLLV